MHLGRETQNSIMMALPYLYPSSYFHILYNWLIWRVLKLAGFFKKVFSLYLFWRLEQSEQRHLYVDIFLCDL